MNPDFAALLQAFNTAKVRYLVVGAYALAHHGCPRATGDIDVWVGSSPDNGKRVLDALAAFGAPLQGVSESDFSQPGIFFRIGVEPVRIDVLTEITGVDFPAAWSRRQQGEFGGIPVQVLAREDFIRNKRAIGRAKDIADLEHLGEA